MRKIDLTGKKFNRLTVIEFVANRLIGNQSKRIWKCLCDCGNFTELSTGAITKGSTKSCGCLVREANTTHGRTNNPVYKVWHSMIERCRNPNNIEYKDYGERGIAVCERWLQFGCFIADMGERLAGMTLERKDVNGSYEPSNCRWATQREQGNNRRNNRIIEFNGRSTTVATWAREYGLAKNTLLHRLNSGWNIECALTTVADRAKNNRSETRGTLLQVK